MLANSFYFDASTAGGLQVLLSSKVAQVEGRVVTDTLQPASNVYVVLVPETMRGRSERYFVGATQVDGSFMLSGIAPGDYKAFSWESIEPYSWLDSTVLSRYESRAKSFHVDESSRTIIDLRVIR